ncbi:MAG: hypothetical protein KDG54_19780, partial [Geminicoccaceae bacterium]|nr:hypothetical protein [Geminicoccaceae bacterium]
PWLSQDENGRPCLDQAKIKRAEHLDGKFVLTTNDDTLSVADIALGYKGMWIIESCFRRMKTTGLARSSSLEHQPANIGITPVTGAEKGCTGAKIIHIFEFQVQLHSPVTRADCRQP